MTPTAPDATARPHGGDDDWQTARQMGHELNNLICAIQGYAEMLLEDLPEDAGSAPDLQRIRDAAGRAAEIVSDLRGLARRAGATPPPPPRD